LEISTTLSPLETRRDAWKRGNTALKPLLFMNWNAIASFYPISSHSQPIECKSISIGPQWMEWQRRTKKLRAQFYRISRSASYQSRYILPVPLLSAIFHYTRRQRKVENCRNWRSRREFLLIWNRRRVQRSLILAVPPMLIFAGESISAAACLSGVRFLCAQDTC